MASDRVLADADVARGGANKMQNRRRVAELPILRRSPKTEPGWIVTFTTAIVLAIICCIAPAIAKNAGLPTGPVDLNVATIDQLDALPGIDARRASKIVKARPYSQPDELLARGIISASEFNKIKNLVTVSVGGPKPAAPLAAQVNLNTASAADLTALPGIDPTRAAAIIAARPYERITQLVSKDVMPKSLYDTIKNSVTVSPPAAVGEKKAANDQGLVTAKPPSRGQIIIDLNTATVDDMIKWLGIGPTRAKKIIAGRPYAAAEEVVTKGYLSKSTFDRYKNRIVVSGLSH